MDPSEQLTCPLCLDPYNCSARKPIDVGCGHSYCHECFDNGSSKGAFNECPECRRPSSNVHINFSLLRALEATQEQQQLLQKQQLEIEGLLAQLDIQRESSRTSRTSGCDSQRTEQTTLADAASTESGGLSSLSDVRTVGSFSEDRSKQEREEEDRRVALELQRAEEEAYWQAVEPKKPQQAWVYQGARGTYMWRIPDFQRQTTEKLYSQEFEIGALKWRLLVFPRGQGGSLPVYLDSLSAVHAPDWKSPTTHFKLILVNQRDPQRSWSKETSHWFHKDESDWGFAAFIAMDNLLAPDSPYLAKDGSLELRVEIQERGGQQGGEEESRRVALQLQKEEEEAYLQLKASRNAQDLSGPEQQQQQQQQQSSQEKTVSRLEELLSADRARVQRRLADDRASWEHATDPSRSQDASGSRQQKDRQERRPTAERAVCEPEPTKHVGPQDASGSRQQKNLQERQPTGERLPSPNTNAERQPTAGRAVHEPELTKHVEAQDAKGLEQQQPLFWAQPQSKLAVVRVLQDQEEAKEPKDLPSLQSLLHASKEGCTFDLRGRELDGLTGDLVPAAYTTIKNGTLLLQGSSCVRVAAECVCLEGLTLKGMGQQPKVVGVCKGGSLEMASCSIEGGLGWDGGAVIVGEGGSLHAQDCSMQSRCNGLLVRQASRATLERCKACGNGRRGVYVADSGSTLHAQRCIIGANGGNNLYVYRGARVSLKHVSSDGSKSGHGWCVMGRNSSLSTSHSTANSNTSGAYVGLGATAILTASVCSNNVNDGFSSEGSGSTLVAKTSTARGNNKRDVNECMGGRVCICDDRL